VAMGRPRAFDMAQALDVFWEKRYMRGHALPGVAGALRMRSEPNGPSWWGCAAFQLLMAVYARTAKRLLR